MIKKYLPPFFVGILSGIISVVSFAIFGLFWFVGIPFGIVTGLYIIRNFTFTKTYLRLALWIVMSSVSYISGVMVTIYSGSYGHHEFQGGPNYFALGGFIGVALLILAFNFIFQKIKGSSCLVLLVVGAVIPFVIYQDIFTKLHFPNFQISILYIFWQTIVITLLASNLLTQNSEEQIIVDQNTTVFPV